MVQFLSRNMKLPTSSVEIKSRFEPDQWLMTDAERSVLTALLRELRPESAIEIGTYKAGSLGVLSKYCKRVYTLDVDPNCLDEYEGRFPNVHFVIGRSKETLPPLLERIQLSGEPLGFVLIDADHSEEGVRRDIEDVIRYTPMGPLYIIIHDSFNPGCRRGILTANWSSSPYVHMIEVDYIPGRFVCKEGGDNYRQMWCGFALAVLLPEPRAGDILFHQNDLLMFRTAYWHSVYPYQKVKEQFRRLTRLKRKLKFKAAP
jgi:hypothetical protein